MFYNDSIEQFFLFEGEDLLDAEDEVNDNLEDKALTERFEIFRNIIIRLWDISELATR